MTAEIQVLSKKLARLYGVDAYTSSFYLRQVLGDEEAKTWLVEDSGRISDLADENGISVMHFNKHQMVSARYDNPKKELINHCEEYYSDHPLKSAAARMARVRCLLVIGYIK